MNSIKNTLLLVNGNIDGSSEYNSKQIGDQSGNYWISSNSEVIYSDDILNPTTSEYHKSIAFNENSDCATVDVNHLLNFSDREFSVDTWVKFDTTSHDLSKRHIIVSKWDNTGSVDDDKVFRFYYKHTTPPETRLYYEDIYISFSSTEVLINGNSTDTFEFSAGRAYRLTFSNEYLEKDIGIPEGVGFSSNELLFSGVSNYSLDLDESGYEELDNLEDLLIKNSEDLPYPEFVDFPEDDIVSESSDDYVSYMRQRYGILHSYIVEIENGILLNLPAIGTAEFGDVEIKLSNITRIGDETSFEEDSDSENDVVSLISMTKQVSYNRQSQTPYGTLVFEFNGIRGYESEYRNIKLESEFIFKNIVYESSDDNTFFPTNFSNLNFDQVQLDKMNPDISKLLNDASSKVWRSNIGILIYSKFFDYGEFYTSRSDINVASEGDEPDINKFEYEKYLNKTVDQRFLFLPCVSVDVNTGWVKFLESQEQPIEELSESLQDYVNILEETTYISDGICNFSFDYSLTQDNEVIVSFYTKEDDGEYTWKEKIRLSSSEIRNITDGIEEFISDVVDNTEEVTENTEMSDEEFANIDSRVRTEYDKTTGNSVYAGRYVGKHTTDNYIADRVVVYITKPNKNWSDRTAFDTHDITDSSQYIIDAIDITDHVSSGMKYELPTDDLIDGQWHHLYFGRVGLTTTDEQTGNDRVVFGVDGNFTEFNNSYASDQTIPYMKLSNDTTSRVVKLTSIQPFYEAITGKTPYEKFLNQSLIKIGSDNQSIIGNLHGVVDSLRINEFLTFKSQEELTEYHASKTQPECWMYISDSNNYAIYDENTQYNLSGRSGIFGVDLLDVIRYTELPTNKFEAFKHEMGSVSYIRKFVDSDYDEYTDEKKDEVVNSWRWRLKFLIPVNELIKTKETIESQLEYANEYLEQEILNGK
jgi:hypothetical protein